MEMIIILIISTIIGAIIGVIFLEKSGQSSIGCSPSKPFNNETVNNIHLMTKTVASLGITAEEAASNINRALGAALGSNNNISHEIELKNERSDFFDQSKYK